MCYRILKEIKIRKVKNFKKIIKIIKKKTKI